jgi:ankyrin repeat protein
MVSTSKTEIQLQNRDSGLGDTRLRFAKEKVKSKKAKGENSALWPFYSRFPEIGAYFACKLAHSLRRSNPGARIGGKKMNKSKYRVLFCSLCLMMMISTPSLAAPYDGTLHPRAAVSKAKTKVTMSQEKLDELNTELFTAVDEDDLGAVIRLLIAGAQLNAIDRTGMTPLMQAALRGEPDIVRLLLNKGAQVNAMDIFGVTALMQAAWAGHAGIVEMLVAHGADPNLQSTEQTPKLRTSGVSALMAACMNGNVGVVKFLLAENVNVDQRDTQGQSALMYAAREGNPQIVGLLLSSGANMEMKDEYGRTALTIATIYNRYDAACTLVSAGANVYTQDIHNMTPIVYASALDHGDIYRFLKEAMLQRANCAAPQQCSQSIP